ncbi:MAG: carbon-nitrogen hydrolase family protein [Candidatus Odinarchaeota archaeon]
MKAAIISNCVTSDFQTNQSRILELAAIAVKRGAELVLFPEAAATGLANIGYPTIDFNIAEQVPGPRNKGWKAFASENGVFFAAGLLEKEGENIYDSALLFDPNGDLVLHYRRNDSGWHVSEDDPEVYREGSEIPIVATDFGRVAFLICGDLWNDEVMGKLKIRNPNMLLYPFARGLDATHDIESEWNKELKSYIDRWKETGAVVLAANSFCESPNHSSVGGAWCIDAAGKIRASAPILKESVLLVEV